VARNAVNFGECGFFRGSLCLTGRQLGDTLITFNRQVYVVADLKRVLGWTSRLQSNFDSNMRFRTVKNDKNFRSPTSKLDAERMVLKCVSCGVGSIFGSNFVTKFFPLYAPVRTEIFAVLARVV